MSDKKIEPCPMPGCGGECHAEENAIFCFQVVCGASPCGYQSSQRFTESAAIAAHNALYEAAQPKDVGSYEDVAKQLAVSLSEHFYEHPYEFASIRSGSSQRSLDSLSSFLTAKLSELIGPRDVAGLEEAVRELAKTIIIDATIDNGKELNPLVDDTAQAILAAVSRFCDPETKRQRDALAQFAERIIRKYCWDETDPDGGDIQDAAERFGIIRKVIAAAEHVGQSDCADFEIGDEIFEFTNTIADCTEE